MKYFAKYLPVEGEIKDKDFYRVEGITTLWKNQTGGTDTSEFTCYPVERWYDKKVSPVKLFLCSRDIQVGDSACAKGTFHNIAGFEWKEHHAKEYNNNADGYYYKVIGEISPEAVWVTEGMEFDEDDLVFKRVDRENGGGWKYVEVEDTAGFPTIVEIKNPSCKHFH
jgi:hypothetical protein